MRQRQSQLQRFLLGVWTGTIVPVITTELKGLLFSSYFFPSVSGFIKVQLWISL